MASQSFNLIGQEEEQELVAFDTRQSRGPTPQSRPNSRMEEMLSQLIKSYDEIAKSQAEANKALETKMSDLVDRRSTIGRSLQGSSFTGSDPTRRSLTPPGHALHSVVGQPPVTCPGEVQRRSRFSTSEGHRSTHR